MKILHRLLDPVPAPGGGGTTAPAQVTGTGFQPAPNVEEPADNFLDDSKPPAAADTGAIVDPKVVPPVVPGSTVVDPAAPVVPPAPTTYSPEQVAELLKRNTPAAPAAPVVPPKPLTQDEIDQQLNTYKPTDQDMTDLGLASTPESKAALSRVASALVKNAVTVAGILAQEALRKQDAMYQPHIAFAQEQQRQFAQTQYFQDNPTHVGLEPLVAQVADQMNREGGWNGKSPTETFKEVGKRVNDLVTKLKIPVTAPGAATVPAPAVSQPASTRMSTVSTGGQGGAGGAGAGRPADPEAGIWS